MKKEESSGRKKKLQANETPQRKKENGVKMKRKENEGKTQSK